MRSFLSGVGGEDSRVRGGEGGPPALAARVHRRDPGQGPCLLPGASGHCGPDGAHGPVSS